MGFYDQLDEIIAILRKRKRVSYRALKREFDLAKGCSKTSQQS